MTGPVIGAALAAGGLDLVGGLIRNKAEKDAAEIQMEFQERMSSTAYQRATEDMRMAGLNPMLAYAQGGASSPGGAKPDVQNVLGPAASSAMHGARLAEEIKNLKLDGKIKEQQAAGLFYENEVTRPWQTAEIEQRIRGMKSTLMTDATGRLESMSRQRLQEMQREHESAASAHAFAELVGARNQADIERTGFGKAMRNIRTFRESAFGGSTVGMFLGPRVGAPMRSTLRAGNRLGTWVRGGIK